MPPAGPHSSRKRGAWPEGQSPGPRPRAAERRHRHSPLRPSLKRGPHQGRELGSLRLRIRSLTAASAFRHLVRSPYPAGPDIRPAHSVLEAAPTHVRTHATHARTHARARAQAPPGAGPPPRPALSPGARAGGRRAGARRAGPEEEAGPGEGAATSSRPPGRAECCRALPLCPAPRWRGVTAGPAAPVLGGSSRGCVGGSPRELHPGNRRLLTPSPVLGVCVLLASEP